MCLCDAGPFNLASPEWSIALHIFTRVRAHTEHISSPPFTFAISLPLLRYPYFAASITLPLLRCPYCLVSFPCLLV